jgi:hypothetical protein
MSAKGNIGLPLGVDQFAAAIRPKPKCRSGLEEHCPGARRLALLSDAGARGHPGECAQAVAQKEGRPLVRGAAGVTDDYNPLGGGASVQLRLAAIVQSEVEDSVQSARNRVLADKFPLTAVPMC